MTKSKNAATLTEGKIGNVKRYAIRTWRELSTTLQNVLYHKYVRIKEPYFFEAKITK